MIHVKINKVKYIFILSLVFMGTICISLFAKTHSSSHGNTIPQVQTNFKNKNHPESDWDTVQIAEKLQKRYPNLCFDHSFRTLTKKDCLKLKWMKEDRVEEFYEFTVFTEAFQLQFENKYYLILLGQAAGATGIGVGYREYECYEYGNETPILKFFSLISTPFAVFFDKETNKIGYWDITKEERTGPEGICEDPYSDYDVILSAHIDEKPIYTEILEKGYGTETHK